MKTKFQIMNLLCMDAGEYAQAVEAFGYAFVIYYCANCTGAVEYLTRTGAFWKWWKRHFDLRDEIFLSDYSSYTDTEMSESLREYWDNSHSPETIEGRMPNPAWRQMLDAIRTEEDSRRPIYNEQIKINL
jgi:hypothetical protein